MRVPSIWCGTVCRYQKAGAGALLPSGLLCAGALDRVSRDLKVAQIETEEMYMDSRDETEPDKE